MVGLAEESGAALLRTNMTQEATEPKACIYVRLGGQSNSNFVAANQYS